MAKRKAKYPKKRKAVKKVRNSKTSGSKHMMAGMPMKKRMM